jgi:hypothetical protein
MRMRKIGGVGELDFEQATFLLGGWPPCPTGILPQVVLVFLVVITLHAC